MKKILVFVSAVFILLSCQKEIDDTLSGSGNGNTGSGDYQPTSANSQWEYNSTTAGNYTLKSLGTDTIINGRKYYKFDRMAGSASERGYMSKLNGIYRQYGEFEPAGQVLEMIYLKDSAVGTSWTETITVSGFSNYHKYTVSARDIQRTVNGMNFKNVIELNYEMLLDDPLGGAIIQAGGGKQYYAKNVGAIESWFKVSFFGINVSDTTKLVSYDIK